MKRHIRKLQIMTLLTLCFLLFLTGCGEKNEGGFGSEKNWKNGQGELSEQIGSPDNVNKDVSPPPYYFFEDYTEVIDNTEYNMPTSKWFIHDDEGEFGYGLPSGTMEAGAAYAIKLFPLDSNNVQIDRDVRIQLTKRDQDYGKSKLIMEDTIHVDMINGEEEIYTNQLPERENVVYVLSVEILDEQDEVEDTMVDMIYVPSAEINATLTTDKDVYQTSDVKASITLKNIGPTFLLFGTSYTIEKKVKDSWKVVPLDLDFEDIGIYMDPNDAHDQTIDLDQLAPGTYRVVKDVVADGLDLSATLAVEFSVED